MSQEKNKILIASDHAGFKLKEFLMNQNPDHQWDDLGVFNEQKSDYPDQAKKLCQTLEKGKGQGVLVCGSGQGMAMQANRYPGVRAVVVWDEESTRLAREHNHANVLCLGARLLSFDKANELLKIFLQTSFKEAHHSERIKKLDDT